VFIIKRGRKMVYSYKELLENGVNRYQIEKKVANKELYKIERGLYSNEEFPNELEIIAKKYSKSILTLNSAFFYYELTDKIPDYYYLATEKKARNIGNKSIK
jgi:predicted transcriptional regulator of viral defense system